jgi:3D (Asp-Asp-Asp) domain-containing protein
MKLLLLTLALALTTPAHAPKLRRFTVTAYCHCRVCTHRGDGITASGVRVREGITIAAPRSIPFGTRIHIPGAGWRTVQDRLSRRYDHRLDIVFHLSPRRTPMGHSTPNLHNPMTTRIHKPSTYERKIHTLSRPGAPPYPAPLPLPPLQPPNRLNLKQSRAGLPCDTCTPSTNLSNHERIRIRQINPPAHVRSSPLRHLFADK